MVAPNRTAALQTVTTSTLLKGLDDGGSGALWQQFVDRYRPLILGYSLRLGLSRREAEELAEVSLVSFSTAYREGRYARAQGGPASWLLAIVQREMLAWRPGPASDPGATPADGAPVDWLPNVDDTEARAWEAEWHDAILRQCLAEVRHEVLPESYRAFVGFAVEGRPAAEVAAELGTTSDAVYLAKRLILTRLRDLKPVIEDLY